MSVPVFTIPANKLVQLGLHISDTIHYQLSPEELTRQTLRRKEGVLNDTGALVILTGEFTGRSPKDRFIVKDEISAGSVHWNDFNQAIDESCFDRILDTMTRYLNELPEIWGRNLPTFSHGFNRRDRTTCRRKTPTIS